MPGSHSQVSPPSLLRSTHDEKPMLFFLLTYCRPPPAITVLGSVAATAIENPLRRGNLCASSRKATCTPLAFCQAASALLMFSRCHVLPPSLLRISDVLKHSTMQ